MTSDRDFIPDFGDEPKEKEKKPKDKPPLSDFVPDTQQPPVEKRSDPEEIAELLSKLRKTVLRGGTTKERLHVFRELSETAQNLGVTDEWKTDIEDHERGRLHEIHKILSSLPEIPASEASIHEINEELIGFADLTPKNRSFLTDIQKIAEHKKERIDFSCEEGHLSDIKEQFLNTQDLPLNEQRKRCKEGLGRLNNRKWKSIQAKELLDMAWGRLDEIELEEERELFQSIRSDIEKRDDTLYEQKKRCEQSFFTLKSRKWRSTEVFESVYSEVQSRYDSISLEFEVIEISNLRTKLEPSEKSILEMKDVYQSVRGELQAKQWKHDDAANLLNEVELYLNNFEQMEEEDRLDRIKLQIASPPQGAKDLDHLKTLEQHYKVCVFELESKKWKFAQDYAAELIRDAKQKKDSVIIAQLKHIKNS